MLFRSEGDRAGLGVMAGQGGDPGTLGLGPRCLGCPAAVPGAGAGEQLVGAVDLVAGGTEVLPDRAEVGAAGDAVFEEPGGLRMVGVGVAGAGVDAQLGLQRLADRAGADETDQALCCAALKMPMKAAFTMPMENRTIRAALWARCRATSARCRDRSRPGAGRSARTVAMRGDARRRAGGSREWRWRVSRPGAGSAAGPGSAP